MSESSLIESDAFPFEFLSVLAERESWRKEVHRPVYHVHKWWAKRLGSVFRGILLGYVLPKSAELADEFYKTGSFPGVVVFDPFMGSGTTVGEAHKLELTALGRDINPVAVETVATALGPMQRRSLLEAFDMLEETVGQGIRNLYRSRDSKDRSCDVLYHFWVMRVRCPECSRPIDLFPSHVVARNAYPNRKPEVQILCPGCGDLFPGKYGQGETTCPTCSFTFDARSGAAKGASASCGDCRTRFNIIEALTEGQRPDFRLYAKLVLDCTGQKEYLRATRDDLVAYQSCSDQLDDELREGRIRLPTLELAPGYNTRQAMRYGFRSWRDFFNDRQLLSLGLLRQRIEQIPDESTRRVMMMLFSGVLEFNNLFASYKGEGTGAVRHMFSHHILKPERAPIEANVWGTSKSSGSFVHSFEAESFGPSTTVRIPRKYAAKKGQVVCVRGPSAASLSHLGPKKGLFRRAASI